MKRFKYILFVPFLTIVFYGCISVGPDYETVKPDIPDSWNKALLKDFNSKTNSVTEWWKVFNDPVLDELIAIAETNNYNLKTAFQRISTERAMLGIKKADFFPSVVATGSAQGQRVSEDTTPILPDYLDRESQLYQIGASVGWEIDLWGKIRRSVEAASASLDASIESYRDTLVILYSEVAINYIQLMTEKERLRFAKKNLKAQEKTLKLTQDRYDAGLVPALDISQAKLNLANTEALIPDLENNITKSINRIKVLTGDYSETIDKLLAQETEIPVAPKDITLGVPIDLIRRRPDVRKAERKLAEMNARIGVAKADYFPTLSLPGTFVLEAINADKLFDSGSLSYSFGPQIKWNLFTAGKVKNKVNAARSLTKEAEYKYQQTLLLAVEEVEDAMSFYATQQDKLKILQRSVIAAEESVKHVNVRYKAGLTDFQNVLLMEQALFEQQDLYAKNKGLLNVALIMLYKALGGGWEKDLNQKQ